MQGNMGTLVTRAWPRTCTTDTEKSWGSWATETGGSLSDVDSLSGQKNSSAQLSGGS